jgi:hypothetical protein
MKRALSLTVMAVLVASCGNVARIRDEVSNQIPAATQAMEAPIQTAELSRVVERKGAMLSVTEVVYRKDSGAWLKSKTLSLIAREPISMSQVLAQFAAKGINVATDLPLDSITYVGTVNTTDAESALKQVLGSVGLDFKTDDARKLVVVKPLASRTWTLNLGNRKTTYASGEMAGGLGGSNSGTGQPQGGGQASQPGMQGGTSAQASGAGGQSGTANGAQNGSGQQNGNQGGGTSVVAAEDFWGALDRELTKRLTVLVPVAGARNQAAPTAQGATPLVPGIGPGAPMPAPMAMPAPGGASGDTASGDLYASKKIGSFSLNPETGAITVQAPHWILNDLDVYFRRTQDMFNTYLSFEGRLLLVTSTRSNSEGFDIQHFAQWAGGRYGAVLSNNGLGGVTVGFGPGKIPSVTAGAQQVGGALMGIISAKDGLQIFNDYLEQLGMVRVLQRPRVATNSGVPGEFSNITPRYYNTVSQTAAAGNTGSATQATSNTIVTKEFGTELQIFPRYDIATGLIRAKIKMRNIIPAGEQQIPQVVNVGSSSQTVIARIPLERRLNYSGEALLRDGDLIIVGGQSEDSLQTDENGVPGDTAPISGLFGIKTATTSHGTYYFALKVSVKKR